VPDKFSHKLYFVFENVFYLTKKYLFQSAFFGEVL
jgi:hypothetical protein